MELTLIEKKIIVRIDRENCYWNISYFPEFPELTEEQIHEGLEKLKEKEFIEFDQKTDEWVLTDKCYDYYKLHSKEFKEIEDEYYINEDKILKETEKEK